MNKKKLHKGSMLMEVVVVSAILAVVSIAFIGTFTAISRFHEKNLRAVKAGLLAEEGIEALRLIKSKNFGTLSALASSGVTSYLAVATSSWGVTTTPEVVDGLFYRSFKVTQVSRDGASDITTVGGTVDPNTLLFDVSVSWDWRNATNTAGYQSYVTNI